MSFLSSYEVFTNLTYLDMMEDDVNDPRGRAQATAMGAGAGGSIVDSYMDNYVVAFRRKYRRRMSESLLKRYGFLPETTSIAKFRPEDYATSLGGTYVNIERKIPEPIIDSTNYTHESFSDVKDLNSWMNIMYGDSYNPVANTLTNVTINSTTGDFTNLAYANESGTGEYLITATNGGTIYYIQGTQKIETGDDGYSGFDQSEIIFAIEMTRISDGTTMWKTGYNSDIPAQFYDTVVLNTTPIITLKEDNVMNPDLDDGSQNYRRMRKMLRKLGLNGEQLVDELEFSCDGTVPDDGFYPSYDSLGNPVDCETFIGKTYFLDGTPQDECGDCSKNDGNQSTIDNAYIFIGTYPGGQTQGEIMALYAFFDFFTEPTTQTFTVSMSNLNVLYEFSSNKSINSGIYIKPDLLPLKTGDYYSIVTEDNTEFDPTYPPAVTNSLSSQMLELIYQRTDTEHDIIKITGYSQDTRVQTGGSIYSHRSGLWYDDGALDINNETIDGTKHSRIIVPLDFYNNIRYRDWLEVYERGMCMIAYSYEKVKLKWYQTGIFKIVIIIIMVAISYFTAGTTAEFLLALSETIFTMMATMMVSVILNSVTDNPMILAIVAIAMIYYGGGFSNANLSTFDGFLKTANTLLETVNKYTKEMEMQVLASDQEKLQQLKEENEEAEEEYKEAFGDDETLVLGSYASKAGASSSSSYRNEAQAFLDSSTGDGQYDFSVLFDVTREIEKRIHSESV